MAVKKLYFINFFQFPNFNQFKLLNKVKTANRRGKKPRLPNFSNKTQTANSQNREYQTRE